jgi:hypothetical protein
MNTDFADSAFTLVSVAVLVWLAEYDDAVVSHIGEVRTECLLDLLFTLFSDLFFSVWVLHDDLGK